MLLSNIYYHSLFFRYSFLLSLIEAIIQQNLKMVETYETVLPILLLPMWLMFIVILQNIVPSIISCFIRITNGVTPEERNLAGEIIKFKKELSEMSMSKEYVKYVKTERQIIKLEQKLKPLNEERKQAQGYAKTSLNMVLYIIMGIVLAVTMYSSYSKAVVEEIQYDWFYPISYFMGLPTGSSSVIGVPFFLLMCRTFINSLNE
jgi:hypothetical protein